MIGALTSGWVQGTLRPGVVMLFCGVATFGVLSILGAIFSICFRSLREASITNKALIPDNDDFSSAENVRLEPQESIS